jgi:hypothetical protein
VPQAHRTRATMHVKMYFIQNPKKLLIRNYNTRLNLGQV